MTALIPVSALCTLSFGALVDPLLQRLDLARVSRSPLGGMMRPSGAVPETSERRRLSAGLPATTAGPLSPPRKIAAAVSSRRPFFCFSGPWQARQCLARIGSTSRHEVDGLGLRRIGERRRQGARRGPVHRSCERHAIQDIRRTGQRGESAQRMYGLRKLQKIIRPCR